MKHEARETIVIGIALIAYGIAAILWEKNRSRLSQTLSTNRLEFARSRKADMQSEEFSEPTE